MDKILSWIDRISLLTFLFAAVALGLAPFFPEPHLYEKIKMLMAGQLTKPIDIFDLIMHGTPSVLLIVKIFRMNRSQ